jgi:hypothetical protein
MLLKDLTLALVLTLNTPEATLQRSSVSSI